MLKFWKRFLVPLKFGLDLGGGGGGDSAPSTTNSTTTVNQYSPEEIARRTKVQDEASRIYDTTKGMFAQYPGAAVVGPSGATQSAEQRMLSFVPTAMNTSGNVQGALNQGLSSATNVQNNPFFRSAVEGALRPVVQNFTDAGGALSQIRDGATAAGQYGGTRQGIAEGLAMNRLGQTLSDTAAKMGSDAYDKGLDTMTKSLQVTPSAMMGSAMPISWESSVGATQDARAQTMENQAAQQRLWGLNSQWAPLQNYANMVYGGGSSQSTTNSTSPYYQPQSSGSNALSTLGTLAGIGGSIASMGSAGF